MPDFHTLHNSLPPLIGVVGNIRAGKTTVCTYLSKRYGYVLASNSDLLKEIAFKLNMQADRESLKRIGDAIFSTLGNDAIAKYRISRNIFAPTVVDGIRYSEEVETYRQNKAFRLLAIVADDDTRYSRAKSLVQKGESKDTKQCFDEFMALSNARSEERVPDLVKKADYRIENTGSIEELESKIDSILHAISASESL